MRIRPFYLWAGLILLTDGIVAPGRSLAQGVEETGTGRPNIVFILADDLGYADVGCYGQKEIATPNIDKLASQGMKFSNAYAAPVCAPSRCSLLTGLTTGHGVIRGNTSGPVKVGLREQDLTITEVLHKPVSEGGGGYHTMAVGKWGIGALNTAGDPTHKGIDYFFGFIDQTGAHNSYPSYLYRNETKVPLRNVVPNEGYYGQGVATKKVDFANDLFDGEVVNYLREEATAKQPFFVYAAFTAPHANNEAHENEVPDLGLYADKPWPLPEKQYAALVTRLDGYVGHIMQELHDRHLEENTVLIFASDNGIQEEGNTKATFFKSSGPLRGIKRDMYEGGYRVPFMVRWAAHIAAGTTSDLPIAFYDFPAFATDVARVKSHVGPDGISFLPTLLGQEQKDKHEFLYWEFFERGFEQAVRFEDWAHHISWKGVRHGVTGKLELFDLTDDLGETKDVAEAHPEIVEKITAYMKTARTDSPDFPLNGRGARAAQ